MVHIVNQSAGAKSVTGFISYHQALLCVQCVRY